MEEIKIILDWAVGHDDENDRLAWELWITKEMIPDLRVYQWKELPEFNQGHRTETRLACTIVNAYREYCYQTNHDFSEKELLDIVEFARTLWYSWWGWVSHWWMEAVRKYFNNWICFIKVENNNPLLWEIYLKRNALWITYKWNDKWNVDSDDWVLDNTTFWTTTYWHRTSTIFYDKAIVVHDSYVGTIGNVYELPAKNISSLVRNWYIYPTFYLWMPLKNIWRISELNKMKVNCQKRIDIAKELKTQTQDINYVKYLNESILKDESKMSDVLKQLKLLQK